MNKDEEDRKYISHIHEKMMEWGSLYDNQTIGEHLRAAIDSYNPNADHVREHEIRQMIGNVITEDAITNLVIDLNTMDPEKVALTYF
jgi:hypothetical protein